jgi:hypothetical protein
MRTYRAEDRAMWECPAEPLDGTLAGAQAYVDRITRSAWWRRTCPPSWMGDPTDHCRAMVPRRVLVVATRGHGAWASDSVWRHRGRWYPRIRLGTKHDPRRGCRPGWVRPPIAEPWVVLHELAHIMAVCADDDTGHGRGFRRWHLQLVARWLGREHAAALRRAYAAEGLRYRAR